MGNQPTKTGSLGEGTSGTPGSPSEQQNKKREQILEELVKTERTYTNYLSVIDEVFSQPMLKRNVIGKENHKELFSSIDPIIAFHRDFFQELAICYNSFSWDAAIQSSQVSMDDGASGSGKSKQIINNNNKKKNQNHVSLEASIDFTDIFNKHKSSVASFLEKARADPQCNGQDLSSLLIMPVQRLPRYVLLLNELLKNTPPGHRNVKILEFCINGIKSVTQFINEAKRDDENLSKMQEFQETLIDKVCTDDE
ncbi:hypothetical protein SAMD00019534_116020 [Acytostelium subglobosum LB1]|uniref:hypothetical protein n=1 Tax=Acytostelium subglobosum LB1 TaxID=1410327 RepID=UPI000644EA4D|nr:hypothetical protein SAMD00019534_116020 [Acytostelium subglobosum LB1]GAM28426.1 hypothetical protein SAMD00019534_116020 [Acytostelium subglobosum LB1]|eukprot:XP_012748743.1 hypothetical protein SAMD00019534_116020 [Acytostelium subglobosum LB1]